MKNLPEKKTSFFKKIFSYDISLFLSQFFRHPKNTGSVAPSSKGLAEAMTRYVVNPHPGKWQKKYLEAGAGTGAFTEALVRKLGRYDTLDIVEINPTFCERLKKKYGGQPKISIHSVSILDWHPGYRYDGIVSSLPFNGFSAKEIREILDHYKSIAKEGAFLSYYEYMALPGIKKLFLNAQAKKALQETLEATSSFEKEHEMNRERIFANLPPAVVHHCRV